MKQAVASLKHQIKRGLEEITDIGSFHVSYGVEGTPKYNSAKLIRAVHKSFPDIGIEMTQEVYRTVRGKESYYVEWKIHV
jgi:hypothetical protein